MPLSLILESLEDWLTLHPGLTANDFYQYLDRYYRIFYTDERLEDSFLVVDARYPDGIPGGAVYASKLVPLTLVFQ